MKQILFRVGAPTAIHFAATLSIRRWVRLPLSASEFVVAEQPEHLPL